MHHYGFEVLSTGEAIRLVKVFAASARSAAASCCVTGCRWKFRPRFSRPCPP